MDFSNFQLTRTMSLLVVFVLAAPASAQRMDSFEGGQPRWTLVESDCRAQLINHEISPLMPHGGRTCELFEVDCGLGSMAWLAYPVEPCAILEEFQPALWTRSSTGDLQLGVRVIFPFAVHPVTGGRLNTVLWGDIYSDTGSWQKLSVDDLPKRFNAELVSLRKRFGSELNLDGAYIDCLVFNTYSGPGRYRVQLDDLNLQGLIPLSATGRPLPSNWRERWRWRQVLNRPSEEQRFWGAPNRPATWLQYQNESLPWLKSIGFTGLIMTQLPGEAQLRRIRDAELAAICPPPPHNLALDQGVSHVIQGWFMGAALDAEQAEVARSAARRVIEMPTELRRPLVGEALEHYWLFSRIADQVILPYPAPLAAGTTREKLAWAERNLQTLRKRGEGWVSLQIGSNPAHVDQLRVAQEIMTPTEAFSPPVDPLGLRYQTACAVLAGGRGFIFRGGKSLDINGAGESAVVAALRWIHSDLALWGPWIVGGQPSAAPRLSREDFTAVAWSVSQSRMVLAVATPRTGQFCVPPIAERPLEIEIGNSASPPQVLRLTDGRLERLDAEATTLGLKWHVDAPAPIETFVITSNPLVIDFVRQQVETEREQRAADRLDIVSYSLGVAAELVRARFAGERELRSGPEATAMRDIDIAGRQLEQGYQALRSGQPTAAMELSARASERVQSLLSEAQLVALSNLAAPQSSPFVVSPAALRYHWLLAEACQRSEWRDLELPGAQFHAPAQMEALGWSLQQRAVDNLEAQIELLPVGATTVPGLRLAAYRKGTAELAESIYGGYEGASVRVRSAAAPVRRGQLIRVSAKARVLKAPLTDDSGVLIYDNQAGPSLGQLVRGQVGEVVDIELYRFAVADGEFRILAECRGQCDIVLESLHASVIEPAVNRQTYFTIPTMPLDSID